MVRRRPGEDGTVEVELLTTARGGSVATSVQAFLATSDGVLPGVLSIRPRNGLWVPTLRMRGYPATISPHDDRPPVEAVELRTQRRTRVLPLVEALELLELHWLPMSGGGDEDATQEGTLMADEAEEDAGVTMREAWALTASGEEEGAEWARVSVLSAMGVVASPDGGGIAATDMAALIAGAGQASAEVKAVEWALLAAYRDAGADKDADAHGLAAGEACAAALRAALDVVGTGGTAEVAREARAFRADVGVAAGAVARGAFMAQVLRARAMAEAAARDKASPARSSSRPSPPRASSQATALTLLDDSPRSREIARLTAEKAAELAEKTAAERARRAGARTLDFTDATADGAQRTGGRRGADGAPPSQPPAQRPRGATAVDFVELRPRGAETLTAAEVVRHVEAALAGTQRVTTAISRAAGRPHELIGLVSADSGPALRAAAADWRTVHARVAAAGGGVGDVTPPADCPEAADRLLAVLMAASEGAGAQRSGAGGPAGAGALMPPPHLVKSLHDVPAGSTTKRRR